MTDSASEDDAEIPANACNAADTATDSTAEARRARDFVLESHAETVEAVLNCADAVAETWDGDATSDPKSVAGPLRAGLEAAGVWESLPAVLAGAVRATDYSLSATPVAAPPYVVATSRGPMLRATLDEEGNRLVVLIQVFEIERESKRPTKYIRGATTPADAVRANFK